MAALNSTRHIYPGYGQPPPPRPLLPLQPPLPTADREIPRIPRRPSEFPYDSPFGDVNDLQGWHVETLCFQAAKPRRLVDSVKLKTDRDQTCFHNSKRVGKEEAGRYCSDTKDQLRKAVRAAEKEYERLDEDALGRKAEEQESLLIAVNRYFTTAKKGAGDGLTLVTTHGLGHSKELWEPILAKNLKHGEDPSLPQIREIWSLDNVACGDSAILNEGYFGPLIGEMEDQANDILQFLLFYLPQTSSDEPLSPVTPSHAETSFTPALLPVQSPSRPPSSPLREVAFLSHSAGGGALLSAVSSIVSHIPSSIPNLKFKIWASIFVDPALHHPYRSEHPEDPGVQSSMEDLRSRAQRRERSIKGILCRRGKWENREQARIDLERRTSKWDPAVKRRYVEMGVIEGGGGPQEGEVELKCKPRVEAVHYAHWSAHAWQSLSLIPSSPDSPRTVLILPDAQAALAFPEIVDDLLDRVREPLRSGNLEIRRYDRETHMIVYEKADLIAKEAVEVLRKMTSSKADVVKARL